jgi:hypothetical protein
MKAVCLELTWQWEKTSEFRSLRTVSGFWVGYDGVSDGFGGQVVSIANDSRLAKRVQVLYREPENGLFQGRQACFSINRPVKGPVP